MHCRVLIALAGLLATASAVAVPASTLSTKCTPSQTANFDDLPTTAATVFGTINQYHGLYVNFVKETIGVDGITGSPAGIITSTPPNAAAFALPDQVIQGPAAIRTLKTTAAAYKAFNLNSFYFACVVTNVIADHKEVELEFRV